MKYNCVLFDLDGTLTDSQEGITASVQYALKSFGIVEEDMEKLKPFLGPPLKESFMKYYRFDARMAEKAVEKYREWFVPKGMYQNQIYPGIAAMLADLKAQGKTLAVASSKPEVFVKNILEYFEILNYFEVVVGSELDGGRSSKEEVVEEALRQLSLRKTGEAGSCVMVGDREFDIQGGKAHGLNTVGVSYGYAGGTELQDAGADFIADSVKELQELLTK